MRDRSRQKTPVLQCKNCGTKIFDPYRNTTGLCRECFNRKRAEDAHRCLDCGIKLANLKRKRCMDCRKIFNTARRMHCQDCGKQLGWNHAQKRCRPCHFKIRAAKAWHCIDCGKKLKQHTERCKACYLKFMSNERMITRMSAARATALMHGPRSKAELHCEELLLLWGKTFQVQVPHGQWILDFVLEEDKTVIEVHGEYWHRQASSVARDTRKRLALEAKGYQVIFLMTERQHLWFVTLWQVFGSYPSNLGKPSLSTTLPLSIPITTSPMAS